MSIYAKNEHPPQILRGAKKFKLELFSTWPHSISARYRPCPAGSLFLEDQGGSCSPRIHPSPSRKGQGPPCALSPSRILFFFAIFVKIPNFRAPSGNHFCLTRGAKFRPLGGSARPGRGENGQKPKKSKKSSRNLPQRTDYTKATSQSNVAEQAAASLSTSLPRSAKIQCHNGWVLLKGILKGILVLFGIFGTT